MWYRYFLPVPRGTEAGAAVRARKEIELPEGVITKSKLICPICRGPDRGNTLNGKPTCFECRHELVPESELKNYPRKYRRAWKRSRKR